MGRIVIAVMFLVLGLALGRFGPTAAHVAMAAMRNDHQPAWMLQSVAPDVARERSSRLAFFRNSTGDADVVMLGDSLIANGPWEELLPGVHVLNRGIGWDSSRDVLERVDEVISHHPKKVFVLVGVNDLRWGVAPSAVAQNVHATARRLAVAGAQPVIIGVPGVSVPEVDARIAELNRENGRWTKSEGVRFIDISGKFSPNDRTADGVHFNAMAYPKLAGALAPALTP